ncbi:MAG: hypothetical protein JXA60_03300 [Candidatus Coatesbacteria bacterium]|nr:hypothetical protein [Candidatus Coatesbacteria bacterium]
MNEIEEKGINTEKPETVNENDIQLSNLEIENKTLKEEIERMKLSIYRSERLKDEGIEGPLADLVNGNSVYEIERQIEISRQVLDKVIDTVPASSRMKPSSSLSPLERDIAEGFGIDYSDYARNKK